MSLSRTVLETSRSNLEELYQTTFEPRLPISSATTTSTLRDSSSSLYNPLM